MVKNNDRNFIIVLFLSLIGVAIIFESFLAPPLAAVLFIYLFYPFRNKLIVKRILIIVSLFLSIWIWFELKHLLTPFLIALFLAYLFDPVIDLLEKKINRTIAVVIFLIVVLGVFFLILLFIIPNLIDQIKRLITTIGKNQDAIISFIENKWEIVSESKLIDLNNLTTEIQKFTKNLLNQFINIFTGLTMIFKSLFNIIIIPVVGFYLLRDYDSIKKWVFERFSEANKKKVEKGYKRFNKIFGRYVRGVLTDAIIVGILTYIGLSIIGIQFALVIGIITIFFSLLPYIGIWISFSLSVLIVLTSGGSLIDIVYLSIVYFTVQILEGTIIYPKVIGKMIGLHPVVIMMTLLILAHFLGIIGFLIGVPTTALIWYFIERRFYKKQENSS
ncbi:MAG TPA: AI-2E family transporter [Candidatus Mcinerneyibacterium sp.]|nr:AI-2E family transporter [Candidatus Mcinerneyibacterium sp.]